MKLLTAASLLLLSVAAPGEEAAQFRGGTSRTGSDGSAVPSPPSIVWKYRDPREVGRFCSSPAVADGRVYIGCDNETLYCFDAVSGGKPVWTFAARHWIFSSPTLADGIVYCGEGLHVTRDARIYAVEAPSGKLLWEHRTKSHVECGVAVSAGRIFAGAGDDGLVCLDAATGKLLWQDKDGLHIDGSPLVIGDRVVAGSGLGVFQVRAWETATGKVLWKRPRVAAVWGPPAKGPRGILIATGDGTYATSLPNPKGAVICLSPEDGTILWETPLRNASLAAVAISGGRAWLGDRSGDVSCLDATTGARLWTAGCGHPVLASAAVASNAVVTACEGGHVHGWHPETGKEAWTVKLGRDGLGTDVAVMSSPAIAEGRIYVGSNNGSFYCLGEKK